MKIYFSASITRATAEHKENYSRIIQTLKDLGHNVFSENIEKKTRQILKNQSNKESLQIQRKLAKRKKQADMVVLEVSTPSFGVGQELAYALTNKKQVLALYTKGNEPHLLRDDGEDSLFIVEYDRDDLKSVLEDYIDLARDQMDIRFNFFVSPKIVNHFDFISRKRRMPRAVYLRRLIEDDMEANEEYQQYIK